jgi:ubiquinone/menaquinone biosynthesis C-methylase UbiE
VSFSAVKNYYDKKGASYDDYSKQLWSKVYDEITWRLIKPYIPADPHAVVFDAAGGTGKWSIPLAKCGPKVVLGDGSEGMLKVAREKIINAGLQERIEVKTCNLQQLDFKDETFDVVLCEHALCFIKEQETVIRELVRVLKKGCPLIISGQNRYVLSLSMLQDADFAFRILTNEAQFVMRNSLSVYALSPGEFRGLLEDNGLTIALFAGKLFTMPLALPQKQMTVEKFSMDWFSQLLKIEIELANQPDAIAIAGHLQAICYKRQ